MKLKHWVMITAAGVVGIVAVTHGSTYAKQQLLVQQLLNRKTCAGCDFKGANLAGLDLSGTNLQAANLQDANLRGAKLGNAILTDANLQGADLTDADLGCATVNFNLQADDQTANVDLTVDSASSKAINQRDHILNFDFDADGQGATMSLNFGGCATLNGANLNGATMPNGAVYQ